MSDLERMPKVTLLPLGDCMGYIIPDDALPDGVTIDVMHDSIENWRRGAE